MSPALLTKYLDAAKEIASHAVLLPDGIRFSPSTTRRDWTDEILARDSRLLSRASPMRAGRDKVDSQGIVFDTNDGGRLPLEKYLAATLELRDAPAKSVEAVANGTRAERQVSRHPLGKLLNDRAAVACCSMDCAPAGAPPSPTDAAALVAEIAEWQKALWKFSSVGHIGKVDGPKAWMEAGHAARRRSRKCG